MAKDIPPIPGTIPTELQRPLQRMREELQRLLGYRGDERAITTANAASLGYLFSGVIGSAGTGGGTAEEPDLTAPPTPTFGDGDAVGGLTNVLLSWGGVTYPQGHGNLQTVIYAVKKATSDPDIPTFPGDAGIVATAPHPLTIYAIPSEPNTRWHLWLKFESVDGVRSLAPAGGTNGVVAVTGQDISQLLQILTNSINTSELAAALAARINLIDAGDGVAGSVNARILAETTARIDAVTAETDARILAISNEVDARLLAEDGLQSQIDLLAGSVGGDLATFFDVLLSETSSRVEADLAAANAITLANATIADTAFGLNTEQGVRELADAILSANAATTVTGANNTAAGLAVEQQIRAAADGAVASQAASLAVTAGDNAAAVRIEQIARATADDAQANSTVSLAAAGANTAAALQVEQTARATADSAQATSTTIIGAAVAGAAAAIKVEQDARAGADLAAASQIASLSASVASANAAIVFEQEVRASADTATSSQVMALAASVGGSDGISAAAIVVEQQVRATADATLAAQQATLSAATSDNLASVIIEQDARATADSAAAAQSAVLGATAAAALAGLVVEQETRANGIEAVASQSTVLTANVAEAGAAIKAEQLVRAAADDVVASQFGTVGASVGANTAAIQTEQTVRAGADGSAATLIDNALVTAGASMAGILTEQQIRAAADEASARQVESLAAAVAASSAAITLEQNVRADADSSTATQLQTLFSAIGSGDELTSAAIVFEQQTRATADEALAAESTMLRAQAAGNTSAIQNEQVTRATADSATATQAAFIGVAAGTAMAGLTVEQASRVAGDAASTTQNLALQASFANTAAAILAEQQVRAGADSVNASQVTVLGAKIEANNSTIAAAIETEQDARVNADVASASVVSTLAAVTGATAAAISQEQSTRSAADSASAAQAASLAASVGSSAAGLQSEQSARAAAGTAVAEQSALLTAAVGSSQAAVLAEQLARAAADSSVAGQVSTLTASMGTNTAAIATEQSVRAALDGSVQALYTVRAEVSAGGRPLIGGWGLSATSTASAGPRIAIGFRADEFFVDAPAEPGQPSAGLVPFTIRTTTFTNGGVTMDPGVYIDAANIVNLTVLYARIASLVADSITAASISVAKLTAGSLDVGAYIQSTGYTSGSGFTAGTGFRISGDGNAEFNNATVRGTVYATAGILRGLTIQASDGSTIVSAGASAAATTFAGNVTGAVAGTAAATLVTTANNALSDANQALTDAFDANAKLADIYADGKLTPVEKQAIRSQWDAIYAERADIRAKADAMGGVATEKTNYDNAFEDLGDYLNGGTAYTIGTTRPLWIRDATELGNTTTISGDVFRATWATLYTARQVLLNKIAEVAATKANWTGIASRPGDDELLNTQGAFQAEKAWNFNGGAEGWTWSGMSSVAANAASFTLVSGGTDPTFTSPTISVYGPAYSKVRVRVRRLSGALPAGFDCYYKTSGFVSGWTGLYYKNIVPPASMEVGAWVVVEFDMASLTAGTGGGAGYEWTGSTITQIRLDFGAATGDTYEIDWIAIGNNAPGSYGAPSGSPVGDTTADVVAGAAAAVNDGTTGLSQRLRSNAQNVLAGAGGLATGTLAWNSGGVRTSGYGVGFTQNGIVAYNSSGAQTFVLDGSTGNAAFGGVLTANAVDAVNTINIAHNAVAVVATSIFDGYVNRVAPITPSPYNGITFTGCKANDVVVLHVSSALTWGSGIPTADVALAIKVAGAPDSSYSYLEYRVFNVYQFNDTPFTYMYAYTIPSDGDWTFQARYGASNGSYFLLKSSLVGILQKR